MAIISNGGVKYQLSYIRHVSQCQVILHKKIVRTKKFSGTEPELC